MPTCHSTNEIALQKLNTDPPEGTLIVTDNQTSGKGQHENKWEAAPYKNITLSLILRPDFLQASDQFRLNIAISLGVQRFLSKYLPSKLFIKWPNDIYHADKKICGMLIQNIIQAKKIKYSIIGLGININQEVFFYSKASSLKNITQNEYSLKTLIEELMLCIENTYLALKKGDDSLKVQYLQCLYWYQERHLFRHQGKDFFGVILGVDAIGRLCVEKEGKIEYFALKEIQYMY